MFKHKFLFVLWFFSSSFCNLWCFKKKKKKGKYLIWICKSFMSVRLILYRLYIFLNCRAWGRDFFFCLVYKESFVHIMIFITESTDLKCSGILLRESFLKRKNFSIINFIFQNLPPYLLWARLKYFKRLDFSTASNKKLSRTNF